MKLDNARSSAFFFLIALDIVDPLHFHMYILEAACQFLQKQKQNW